MNRPTLHYLQIADFIAGAGGDPWAIDDSLQSASPARIDALAQARAASQANIAALNAKLQGHDARIGHYLDLENEDTDYDTEIIECCQLAKADTVTALRNATVIRDTCAATQPQAP